MPAKGARDWFVVTQDCVKRCLLGVPGLRLAKGQIFCHRTHLPLIDTPEARELLRTDTLAMTGYHGFTPRLWQLEGAKFIRNRRGSLLADVPRLGKTATALMAHELADGPLVVVGPLATRPVWLAWFARRFPDEPVEVIEGRSYDRDRFAGAKLVWMHYDVLDWWSFVGRQHLAKVVFDEAHVLSNYKSRRSSGANVLAAHSDTVVLATGTPLWNNASGFYALIALAIGGAFGNYKAFATRYAGAQPGARGIVETQPTNTEELRSRLGEFMLRRTWNDVRDDITPIVRDNRVVKLTEADSYKLDVEVQKLNERQFALTRTFIGQLARYRRLVGMMKVDASVEAAREVLGADRKVVVWSWHRSVGQQIADRIDSPVFIVNGGMSETVRERKLDEWRNYPGPAALVITMAVAQMGIDLSQASDAIMAELDYTPAVLSQTEMRTFDANKPMRVVYISAEHWVEQMCMRVLDSKLDRSTKMYVAAADTDLAAFGRTQASGDLDQLAKEVLADISDFDFDGEDA